jgi:type II secretory pathway pseudopilin PulG
MATQQHKASLVDLVVALVLFGLLAAAVVPYVSGILRRTIDPVRQAQAASALVQVAERIASDYERDPSLRSDLAALRDRIVNRTGNYGSYDSVVCTYVRLDTGNEVAGGVNDVLKVTLANSGAVMVLLFPYRAP